VEILGPVRRVRQLLHPWVISALSTLDENDVNASSTEFQGHGDARRAGSDDYHFGHEL
jgi:hypothetical protein